MKDVAVIVAHPDDEVLGFGGVMRRHSEAGDQVAVLILATGLAARSTDPITVPAASLAAIRADSQRANAELGTARLEFADFPDNRMDSVPLLDVIKRVESLVQELRPSIVYTHHDGDLNVDHCIVARAVLTACRPLAGTSVDRIYAGEVLSASEYGPTTLRFVPTSFVDIARSLDAKCRALACYASELREFPHPRSIEAVRHLALLRGSECGYAAAEGFRVIRERRREA